MAGLLAQTGHWDPDTPMLGLLDPTPYNSYIWDSVTHQYPDRGNPKTALVVTFIRMNQKLLVTMEQHIQRYSSFGEAEPQTIK